MKFMQFVVGFIYNSYIFFYFICTYMTYTEIHYISYITFTNGIDAVYVVTDPDFCAAKVKKFSDL